MMLWEDITEKEIFFFPGKSFFKQLFLLELIYNVY